MASSIAFVENGSPRATSTPLEIFRGIVRHQRRAWILWGLAVAAVTAMYVALYPSMGGMDLENVIGNMPDALVTALGYDRIATAPGYITSTVYGLLGPILLLVFAVGLGARLVAGQEEDGTLELELTAPVSRARLYVERLGALWAGVLVLVATIAATSIAIVLAMDIDVGVVPLLAGSAGLLLLTAGFGTVAYGLGAAIGRRAIALGAAAGLAVLAYIFNAVGPLLDADWMLAVSPFAWFLEGDPLVQGFIWWRLALLASLSAVFGAIGYVRFLRRDLMV